MTALLVASPGGHLDELMLLVDQLDVDLQGATWVTARTPQTESLLAGRDVAWVDHIKSGETARALRATPSALRLHRRFRPTFVMSTGAALAVPHLIAASLHRTEAWYVESASRLAGPSKTGRLMGSLPGVQRFAQGSGWGDASWTPVASVFDAFEAVPRPAGADVVIRSATVTLGTEKYPFSRAVRSASAALGSTSVVWQTGSTVASLDDRQLQRWLSATELRQACRDSDVVITHAGVGSVLMALSEGKVPVILPRRPAHGEHIDEHQSEVAAMLAERRLAVSVEADELTGEHLRRAAGLTAVRRRPDAR